MIEFQPVVPSGGSGTRLGETPLEIVEVQSGSYIGEDGIERLGDQYRRS